MSECLPPRDHGGGLDAAIARYGGDRAEWIDLSTGINRVPYAIGDLPPEVWTALPDQAASARLLSAAREFWQVPDAAATLAAPGASALIARLPGVLAATGTAHIPGPTYNEWAASFRAAAWDLSAQDHDADVEVYVHPNNPDGVYAPPPRNTRNLSNSDRHSNDVLTLYDESFCDCLSPEDSYVRATGDRRNMVLKSFGKFWGLAGLRLGFLIGDPKIIARMADMLGPWPVSGPALHVGARALEDEAWAISTRARLAEDRQRLDALMRHHCAQPLGTPLFRLYTVADAAGLQAHLARHRIWSRTFPYSKTWLRLGLPGAEREWRRLAGALT